MHPAGGRLDRSFDELDDANCRRLVSRPLGQLEKCSSCDLPLHSAENANELHEVSLAGNELSSFGASGIIDLVSSCRSLVTLELQGNNIGPGDDGAASGAALADVAVFARAIGSSNVRYLNISTNALGAHGLRVFFDSLPKSRLASLYVATSFTQWDAHLEAMLVHSIAGYLRDEERSRSLRGLYMMGNSFSRQADLLFVHILCGARDAPVSEPCRAPEPGTSLVHLEYAPERITNYLIELPKGSENSFLDTALHRQQALRENAKRLARAEHEATNLLCAARILGCRAQYLGESPGTFPFYKLPPELKLGVLRRFAPTLDDVQFESVLSYACTAETIGHCCRRRVDLRPAVAPTLQAAPWCWDSCPCIDSHAVAFKGLDSRVYLLPFYECTGTNVPPMVHKNA